MLIALIDAALPGLPALLERCLCACELVQLAPDSALTHAYPRARVGPVDAANVDKIEKLLDGGARQVIVEGTPEALENLAQLFPRDRLVARVSSYDAALLASKFITNIQLASEACDVSDMHALSPSLKLTLEVAAVGKASALEARIGQLHRSVKDRPVHVCAPVVDLPVESQPDTSFSPARAFVACLAPSDRPDGLFPTVVVDETQVALGLVYSSRESICASIASMRGVYWSRSRNQLWRKGETSGAVQHLLQIAMDCDQDALRFIVTQDGGGFCHQPSRSCWGDDSGGIPSLFRTLQSRKQSAPAGSYSARLFVDQKLLSDKLLEEAQELAEAVTGAVEGSDTVQHVVAETADVVFFALTALVKGGGTLEQLGAELDRKALKVKRRPGNAKVERTKAAEERLEGMKKKIKSDVA